MIILEKILNQSPFFDRIAVNPLLDNLTKKFRSHLIRGVFGWIDEKNQSYLLFERVFERILEDIESCSIQNH